MKHVKRPVGVAVAVGKIDVAAKPGGEQTLTSMLFGASHRYTEIPVNGEFRTWPYIPIAKATTDLAGLDSGADLIDESLLDKE